MTIDKEKFSDNDAASIVTLVRRAPLQNMDEAGAVSALLDRFADFYESTKEEKDNGI